MEHGLELTPAPPTEETTGRLVCAAEATRRLAPILREKVRERGAEKLYDEIELPLTVVLGEMEDHGIRIDTYRMGEITARLTDRVEELEARALEAAGEEFQLGSTQQLARILFEKLELPPRAQGKDGLLDRRPSAPRPPRDPSDHRAGRGMARADEAAQHLPPPAADAPRWGRAVAHDVQPGGRCNGSPVDDESQISSRSRFAPSWAPRSALPSSRPRGRGCSTADYSQVELRILAHVSGEPVLREAFARGEDIHAATAAEVLGKERATLTRSERDVAKMVNFGIIYGISAFGLSENLDIPKEEAQRYIDTYLARFPRVQEFIGRTIAQAAADGYVTTLLGRRRPIPELRAANRQTRSLGERLAVNTVMQGTAADIIKIAMVRIRERLLREGRASRLVLQVHDELLLEVPEVETSAVRELVREEMVGAYPLDPPLAVDVGVGDSWGDAKG